MHVSKELLLSELPAYRGVFVTLKDDQDVRDIIQAMVWAYSEFAGYYDAIGHYFKGRDIQETCDNLYRFCKENIHYREETEKKQIISLPTGILTRGYGDCKAYASFIGGCLGAIGRETGVPIDWEYCFASYKLLQQTPYHVFVVVHTEQGDIWVDPTPGADEKTPVWEWTEKVDFAPTIAGVNEKGELFFENAAIGSSGSPSMGLPSTALPLPTGYPAGLPSPYMEGGKIKFTPVPPNFTPTTEQLAWMLIALQLWVYTYSQTPYNVFTYNTAFDGSGLSIADFLIQYMQYYRNPECYNNGAYGWWEDVPAVVNKGIVTVPAYRKFVPRQLYAGNQPGVYLSPNDPKAMHTMALYGQVAESIDFGSPPPTSEHSWIDDVGAIAKVVNSYVMRYITQLIPGVGTLFANAFNKAMNQGTIDEVNLQTGISTNVNQIIEQMQEQEAASASTGDTFKYVAIAAGLLLLWWFSDDD